MSATSLSTNSALLAAALKYARRGWPVFPLHGIRAGACTCGRPECGKRGKHPRTQHGKDDATTDAARIRAWWERWPDANVGGLMGKTSGAIALDVDPPKGEDSLAAILNGSGLPATPISRTGRGRHVLFAHPGQSIGNRTGLRPGLDVRGDGGYIVLPPSTHESGAVYAWQDGSERLALAPMPAWLFALMENPAPVPRANATAQRPSSGSDAYAEAALRKELEAVARAPEGTRNDTLNRAAFNLGQLVAGGCLERARVEAELFTAAEDCDLVRDDGEKAARDTIRSGLEDGRQQPRGPREQPRPPQTAVRPPLEAQPIEPPNPTDLGNAERLAARNSGRLRYCAPWREWLAWDDRRWTRDRDGQAVRLAVETVRAIYAGAAHLEGETERRKLAEHAIRSEAQRRIAGMMELAKSHPRVAVLPETFDGSGTRYLLNVLNGTLDLRTGVLHSHRPEDCLTKLAPVTFDPAARSELWESFLARVVPDPDVRAFLQRYSGSALTGDTGDEQFVLLYGIGRNGKSTFIETLRAMLGDYAHRVDPETILEVPNRVDRRGGPRTDLMALRGVRLVAAIEAGEGRRLDEETVKQLTGGDSISARGLYQNEVTVFVPEFKLFLAVNNRPEIRGGDEAIWSRVLEVPFTVTIPEAERDVTLKARLREPRELAGVLAWAVTGARAWLGTLTGPRLQPPAAIVAATRTYRDEQDRLAPFLADSCSLERAAVTPTKSLRAAYAHWCEQNGERPMSDRELARRLEAAGCRRGSVGRGSAKARAWLGVKLLDGAAPGAAGDGGVAERPFLSEPPLNPLTGGFARTTPSDVPGVLIRPPVADGLEGGRDA